MVDSGVVCPSFGVNLRSRPPQTENWLITIERITENDEIRALSSRLMRDLTRRERKILKNQENKKWKMKKREKKIARSGVR